MKITEDHFRRLRSYLDAGVQATDTTVSRWKAHYESSGLSAERFRWDLLWNAAARDAGVYFLLDEIHKYANDNHIDTALRRYVSMRAT